MKFYVFFILILISIFSCTAQKKKYLSQKIITEFINDIKDSNPVYVNDGVLYIFGTGKDFKANEIKVVFLNLETVRRKIEKDGEFHLIRMNQIEQYDDYLRTYFDHLKAKKDDKVDFIYFDNFNSPYCVRFNCEKKVFDISWCGEKY